MTDSLPRLFDMGRLGAQQLLATIYSSRLQDLKRQFADNSSEIGRFKDPSYWENQIAEDRKMLEMNEAGSPGGELVESLIKDAADTSMLMETHRDSTLEDQERIQREISRIEELLGLIQRFAHEEIALLLEEEAVALRAEAAEGVGRPYEGYLAETMKSQAERLEALADFYDIIIRMLRSRPAQLPTL